MKEIWKPVKGFEDYYKISNTGKIFSIKKNHIRATNFNQGGYEQVSFYIASIKHKHTAVQIHRLVAEAFIDNPHNLPQVNHIDGNKKNNYISNLEWCSRSYNMKHAYRLGLQYKNQNNPPAAKLTKKEVINIRREYGKLPLKYMIEKYGVGHVTLWNIATGKSWRSI